MCSYAKYMLLSYLAVDSEYAMIDNLTLKGSTRSKCRPSRPRHLYILDDAMCLKSYLL